MTVHEIAALPDNWNFNGTYAFTARHIELADEVEKLYKLSGIE